MQAAYESFGCNQGNVFFLGIDKGNTNAAVIQFDSFYGVHYPSASGNQGNGNQVHWDYNIQATPSIVVIKPDKSIAIKQIYPPSTQNIVDSVMLAGGVLQACLTQTGQTSKTAGIQLFPNPVHDYLFISVDEGDFIKSLNIYDLSGRRMQQYQLTGSPLNTHIINTGSLNPGFYIIELITLEGKVMVSKFMRK